MPRGIYKRSKEHIQKLRERKREKSPNWKGGKSMDNGYVQILKPEHPFCNYYGYVPEHRLVMEKHLKRYLKPKEQVHHINGIRDDNRLKNLRLFSNNSEHFKYEYANHPEWKEARRKMILKRSYTFWKKGHIPWNKGKSCFKGKNNPFYGRKHTEETKRKMREHHRSKKLHTI